MDDKLVTIAILPYHKAEILRTRLESEGIECQISNVNLVQAGIASGVRLRIFEGNLKEAIAVMEAMFGKIDIESENEQKDYVLIPVDFSESAYKASIFGLRMAYKLGSKIELIHSYSSLYPYTIPYGDPFIGESNYLYTVKIREENTRKNFEEFIARLKAEVGEELWKAADPEYIIKGGEADDDILNYSAKYRPRVIIMGIKGEENDKYGLIGSVTSYVISEAKVPILAIHEDSGVIMDNQVKSVMYATNFDDKDFISIHKLIGLLKPFDVKIYCVHVGLQKDHNWDSARLKGMRQLMNEKYEGLEISCDFIESRDVLQGIENYIKENNIDVIALTTHKRNMLRRLFNPGLARKMVFHTKTPVFVFHA